METKEIKRGMPCWYVRNPWSASICLRSYHGTKMWTAMNHDIPTLEKAVVKSVHHRDGRVSVDIETGIGCVIRSLDPENLAFSGDEVREIARRLAVAIRQSAKWLEEEGNKMEEEWK